MTDSSGKKELNDFWDLDALMPSQKAQKTSVNASARVESVDLAEISVPVPATQIPVGATNPSSAIPPKSAAALDNGGLIGRFSPTDSLIREVRTFSWKSHYSYYEQFCLDAERLWNLRGEKDVCRTPVEFFSYVPQYSQLSRQQLAWYLSWRRAVREERIYPSADYSYVLLYIYEIINLGEKIDPHKGLDQLCGVWSAYRRAYPRLDKLLSEWTIDYCFSHGLSVRDICGCEITPEMIAGCSLREFYVPCDMRHPLECARALIRYCSNYDYHRSKFAVGENLTLYEEHIPAALAALLGDGVQGALILHNLRLRECSVSRDAFVGALCSHRIKKRFEIDYCSFARSYELRFLISDLVKVSENLLRARIGIKSRLSVGAIPDAMKKIVQAYFAVNVPFKSGATRDEDQPHDYDVLYDLPAKDFSAADAKRIEQESWQTTEALVEAFEEGTTVNGENAVRESPDVPFSSADTSVFAENAEGADPEKRFLDAIGPRRRFLRALADNDPAAALAFCREAGVLPDVVAEEINQAALDAFGDILLECSDFWSVIEDYRGDEVLNWEDV